eukprot:3783977-Pleurochrysis_carterae.AAC.1
MAKVHEEAGPGGRQGGVAEAKRTTKGEAERRERKETARAAANKARVRESMLWSQAVEELSRLLGHGNGNGPQ